LTEPIVVPRERLSDEALTGVIDDFILREGTDYGHADVAIEDKRAAVLRQLERGDATIVFDPTSETVSLILTRDLKP